MEKSIYIQKEEADTFFYSLLDRINSFCVRHRMYLTRFEQEAPCWTLRGTHPKGGNVDIFIYYKNRVRVDITAYWQKMVFEEKKSMSKSKLIYKGFVDGANIEKLLKQSVRELLKMKEGGWAETDDYPEWKRYKNKKEWIKDHKLDLPPIE